MSWNFGEHAEILQHERFEFRFKFTNQTFDIWYVVLSTFNQKLWLQHLNHCLENKIFNCGQISWSIWLKLFLHFCFQFSLQIIEAVVSLRHLFKSRSIDFLWSGNVQILIKLVLLGFNIIQNTFSSYSDLLVSCLFEISLC